MRNSNDLVPFDSGVYIIRENLKESLAWDAKEYERLRGSFRYPELESQWKGIMIGKRSAITECNILLETERKGEIE